MYKDHEDITDRDASAIASYEDSWPPMPSVHDREAAREKRWREFEHACREFAGAEGDGWRAVLRAVSYAMGDPRR